MFRETAFILLYCMFILVFSQPKGDKFDEIPDHKYKKQFNVREADNILEEKITSVIDVCNAEGCGGMRYDDVRNLYPTLFHTETELHKLVEHSKVSRMTRMKERVRIHLEKDGIERSPEEVDIEERIEVDLDAEHDWDQCCATKQSFIFNDTLLNMSSQRRTIVHLKNLQPQPMYQLVPFGECVSSHGKCGTCVLEKSIHFLLVIDPASKYSPPFVFDSFEIDTYCSCKSL